MNNAGSIFGAIRRSEGCPPDLFWMADMRAAVFPKDERGTTQSIEADRIVLDRPSVVELQLGPEEVLSYNRTGADLVLTLKDGSVLVIENFFAMGEAGNRNDLVLEDSNGVTWWAQYDSVWDGFEIAEIEEEAAETEATAKLRDEDYQLAYAVDVLKGLAAVNFRAEQVPAAQTPAVTGEGAPSEDQGAAKQ